MPPFIGEHSCRLLSPAAVIQCRRTKRVSDDKTYHIITCEFKAPVSGAGSKWSEQAYRYPIDEWTEAQARSHCQRHKGTFEAAKPKIEKQDLPPGRLVKRREIIKSENGSAILIKIEDNPDSDYPVIKGKEIDKRGLEDYEYLLHHIHTPEGESEERVDHCLLFDHLGNAFELEHLQQGEETYHVVKGLEPSQSVAWSDEEAKQKGIEPKELKAGMNFEEKADIW